MEVFFSARLNEFQTKWLPCEGESLACKLVLEHFKHYIRESKSIVHHFTDSLPCVQAFKRARLGHFSSSARISTFLTAISTLNVEIHHTPGKNIPLVDYISRNPVTCSQNGCQICKFIKEQVDIGDNIGKLNMIQIQDILSGKSRVPFLQRNSWLKAQNRDPTHSKLKQLIKHSQAPEHKKTKHENTKIKLLHNLYREGKLTMHKDGLITVKHVDNAGNQYQAVSVPTDIFPGLVHALHLKLSHPSRTQLSRLIARHFYTPGYQRIIEEVTLSCELCTAMKQLPKEIFTQSTGEIRGFGSNFSADIKERNNQKILIVREKLSSFTLTKLIQDQTAEVIKTALITLIVNFIPQSGTVVQVDCATSWDALSRTAADSDSDLQKLNIVIDLGRHHNKNKNPVIDNACQEFHKELLKFKPEGSALTDTELAIITANINKRVRKCGLSSKEICFQRDLISNTNKHINDDKIAKEIIEDRIRKHPKLDKQSTNIRIGNNVFIKNEKSKLKPRELYIVVDVYDENDETWIIVQKCSSQFRSKQYKLKPSELLLVPGQEHRIENKTTQRQIEFQTHNQDNNTSNSNKARRQAAIKAREKLANIRSTRTKANINTLPTHGWDYSSMLEQYMNETDEYVYVQSQEPLQYEVNSPVQSSNSPTTSDIDTTLSDNENENLQPILSDEDLLLPAPPLQPRLPTDLLARQDLTHQLQLPEVQQAIVIEEEANRRQHNSRIWRRRATKQPSDYAVFSKSGRK